MPVTTTATTDAITPYQTKERNTETEPSFHADFHIKFFRDRIIYPSIPLHRVKEIIGRRELCTVMLSATSLHDLPYGIVGIGIDDSGSDYYTGTILHANDRSFGFNLDEKMSRNPATEQINLNVLYHNVRGVIVPEKSRFGVIKRYLHYIINPELQ